MKTDFTQSGEYALKVWMTGAFAGPGLICLYFLFEQVFKGWIYVIFDNFFTSIGIYLVSAVIGVLVSAPSFFLLWICVWLINRLSLQDMTKKSLIFIVSTGLTMLPYYYFLKGEIWNAVIIKTILPYWLSVGFGIFIYPLKTAESGLSPVPNEQTLLAP